MEKVSDLFKDLKDRLSSPLLSSFLIAWLVTNWRIVIGLLFYKINEVKLDGYRSYADLIYRNISLKNNLIWPLSAALFYTFAFPFVKNVILAFSAWTKRWGGDWTLDISKKGSISVSNYIRLKTKYQALNSELVEITKLENETQIQNDLLNESLKNMSLERDALDEKLTKIKNYNSIEILSGQWKYRVFEQGSSKIDEDFKLGNRMEIGNGLIRIFNDNKPLRAYTITYMLSGLDILILILTNNEGVGGWETWQFKIDSNYNYLVGRDTRNSKIEMERLSPKQRL